MYKEVRISEFLRQVKCPASIEPDKEYSLVTVKLHHKGVVLREKKKGSMIGSKMHRVSEGQFILSGIDARNGAFGFIPKELDGAIVTNDFWVLNFDERIVKREFFYWLTNTPLFVDVCIRASRGETQRIRLQKKLFLDYALQIPPIEHQTRFLQRITWVDSLLEKLDRELDTQDSYIVSLRKTILQEAIEGKLSAEWRRDHPALISGDNHASKLLENIKTEKERLMKEGKIKKEKPLPPIMDTEMPLALPNGWIWCHINDTGENVNNAIVDGPFGSNLLTSDYDKYGEYPVLTITCIDRGFDLSALRRINKSKYEQLKRSTTKGGDVLVAKIGSSYGKVGEYPEGYPDAIIPANLLKITLDSRVNKPFFKYLLSSPFFKKQLDGITQFHAQPAFNMRNFKRIPIPIPPMAEQQAIVDRIENLMNMIDKLEAQISMRKKQSEMLMQSVLREAFAAS